MSGVGALGAAPGAGWFDRWLAFRDRLLAHPAFQHWAVRFPLTRPIANRRAKALFDICAGFVYSQVLAACIRLNLFEMLRSGPLTAEALAGQVGLTVAAMVRLLDSAVPLRLIEHRRDGLYGLGVLGAATLGNPGVAAMVEHHALLYADLRDPVALLRGENPDTALGRLWPYARAERVDAVDVAAYSALMAASQPLVAADILAACPMRRFRCLLDLGGGDGTFLTQAAAAAPDLRLLLFDLPAVADRARVRLAAAGLGDRAEAFGGDFRAGPLPAGADIVSLVRVLHDHDDDAVMAILRTAREALAPGGSLLVAEPMAATPGAETVGAYFQFYLLAMGSGRPRSAEVLTAMLGDAGFGRVRQLPTRRPLLVRALLAQ
jgi:demethylspheroidene O-methyltransferase